MAETTLNLSDEDRRRAMARAAELGYSTVEDYLLSLIHADTELPVSQELEDELLKSLQSPGREFSPAVWEEKRRRLIENHQQAKAG